MKNCILITYEPSSTLLAGDGMEPPSGFMDTRASNYLANAVVRCFNFANGERLLDCYAAYQHVRKIFGSSFAFCFGVTDTDGDFKLKVANECAKNLRIFLLHGGESGVTLCDREVEGLSPVEISAPSVQDCFGRSLLIPTGEVSLTHNVPVFLRVDVVEPTSAKALLQVERILFADEWGNALAGLADIPEPVAGVQDADKAFRAILGGDYEVLRTNARLYHAWSMACGDEFDVDLAGCQSPEYDEGRDVICHFRRQEGWWHLTFRIDGEEYSIGEIVGNDKILVANWTETKCILDALRCNIKRLSPDEAMNAVDFDHILDANHLERFSDGFIEMMCDDPEVAGVRLYEGIYDALEKLSGQHNTCLQFFFNRGQERGVKYAGESFDAVPSLMIPLFLTSADRERCVPSVYLVACLATKADGTVECEFPTVLDVVHATLNHKHFRRAFYHNWGAAA